MDYSQFHETFSKGVRGEVKTCDFLAVDDTAAYLLEDYNTRTKDFDE